MKAWKEVLAGVAVNMAVQDLGAVVEEWEHDRGDGPVIIEQVTFGVAVVWEEDLLRLVR